MSSADLPAFLEAISKDKTLSLQLQALSAPSEVIAFAAELGFEISADDVQALPAELDPQQLDGIHGGMLAMPPED
jgi:predicted ribosomally synthesized peptide with nif11-like leader